MSDNLRESMDFDIVIVGAGSCGLVSKKSRPNIHRPLEPCIRKLISTLPCNTLIFGWVNNFAWVDNERYSSHVPCLARADSHHRQTSQARVLDRSPRPQ